MREIETFKLAEDHTAQCDEPRVMNEETDRSFLCEQNGLLDQNYFWEEEADE